MLLVIFQALYFFLPSYVANATPVLLAHFKIFEKWKIPLDFGVRLGDGEYLFGSTKTWRGLLGGGLAGALIGLAQSLIFRWIPAAHDLYLFHAEPFRATLLGFLLGLGEGLGDAVKSFLKRRLHIKSSGPFFPFDQLSFLGALLLASLVVLPPFSHLVVIVVFSLFIPIIANIIAFALGWKEVWW